VVARWGSAPSPPPAIAARATPAVRWPATDGVRSAESILPMGLPKLGKTFLCWPQGHSWPATSSSSNFRTGHRGIDSGDVQCERTVENRSPWRPSLLFFFITSATGKYRPEASCRSVEGIADGCSPESWFGIVRPALARFDENGENLPGRSMPLAASGKMPGPASGMWQCGSRRQR